MKYESILAVLVFIILMFFAPQSNAADDMFLKIGDVKGESVGNDHVQEIDVQAWSFGGSQAGTTHRGTGGGAGKVIIQDLSITKWMDSATLPLMKAMSNGKHFKDATLTLQRAGGRLGPTDYFIMTMSDVIVTSVSMGGDGSEDRFAEKITLNFAKFEIDYDPHSPGGSKGSEGGTITMKYDIAGNN